MKRSILVFTQDENIVAMVVNGFLKSFTAVLLARTSTRAMEMIMYNSYSLIILDILVQDMEAGMLLQIIRRLSETPILGWGDITYQTGICYFISFSRRFGHDIF